LFISSLGLYESQATNCENDGTNDTNEETSKTDRCVQANFSVFSQIQTAEQLAA
jgi:hypothetical protein